MAYNMLVKSFASFFFSFFICSTISFRFLLIALLINVHVLIKNSNKYCQNILTSYFLLLLDSFIALGYFTT